MFLEWVELPTSHLTELAAFYGDVLGLPVTREGEAVSVNVGVSILRFIPAAEAASPFHFAFNVPSAQFAEAVAWLEARVPLIAGENGETSTQSQRWNADMTYFRDPAGHIGELIARHDLPEPAADLFNARSLFEVSEIGLAVNDVIAAASQLEAAGVPSYRCVPDSSFMSIGDEHGLFIVVRAGRMWFPDRITPAQSQPLRARFRQGSRRFTLSVGANSAITLV